MGSLTIEFQQIIKMKMLRELRIAILGNCLRFFYFIRSLNSTYSHYNPLHPPDIFQEKSLRKTKRRTEWLVLHYLELQDLQDFGFGGERCGDLEEGFTGEEENVSGKLKGLLWPSHGCLVRRGT